MRFPIARFVRRAVAALLIVFAFSFPISIKWIIEASPRPASQQTLSATPAKCLR